MTTPVATARSGTADHRLVFVAGLHRSGTTLLGRCLAEHPQVSGLTGTGAAADEGQHVQSVYPSAKPFGGPGRFAFSPEARLTEQSPLVSDANGDRIFREWSPYWDLDRPYLLEKSPPNIIRLRFLQALFPGSLFIVVTRHPIPVCYATRKFRVRAQRFHRRFPLREHMRHWVYAHQLFLQDEPRVENLIVVRFERLLREPDACLREVYEFLGLEPRATEQEIRPHSNERYFERWRQESRSRLRGRSLAAIRSDFGAQVRELGYSLDDLELVPDGYARSPTQRSA